MDEERHAKYMFKIMKGDIQKDTQLRWHVKVFIPQRPSNEVIFNEKKVNKVKIKS
jgi:hypothetical protein